MRMFYRSVFAAWSLSVLIAAPSLGQQAEPEETNAQLIDRLVQVMPVGTYAGQDSEGKPCVVEVKRMSPESLEISASAHAHQVEKRNDSARVFTVLDEVAMPFPAAAGSHPSFDVRTPTLHADVDWTIQADSSGSNHFRNETSHVTIGAETIAAPAGAPASPRYYIQLEAMAHGKLGYKQVVTADCGNLVIRR